MDPRQPANQSGPRPANVADILGAMSATRTGEGVQDSGPPPPPSDMAALRKELRRRQVIGNAKSGLKHLLIGGGVFVVGLVITFISFYAAVQTGSTTYSIMVGAILIGAAQMLYGVILLMGSAARPPNLNLPRGRVRGTRPK